MFADFIRSIFCGEFTQLKEELSKLYAVNQELELRNSLLTTALEDSFVIIAANEIVDIDKAKKIYPYSHPKLNDYELIVADLKYYAFTKSDWRDLLDEIHPFLIGLIGEWTANISDCDDFALIMNAFVVSSFIKAGFDLQGAFFIAHSRTHAYNVFVDSEKHVWVYEPQTNRVKGLIDKVDDPYKTKKVLCVGGNLPILGNTI